MTLKDLEAFDPVTIQCHDNPDADALGAGFGLYAYFKSLGRQTRLIYSGRNPVQKSNLKIMMMNCIYRWNMYARTKNSPFL